MNISDASAGGPDEAFRQVAIVGLGLIGGSIALAARRRWPGIRVVGIDRPAVLSSATARGAVTDSAVDLDGVADADLVILATPVRHIVATIERLPELAGFAAIVTDVGSTKRVVVEAASRVAPRVTFVGGHPMAGAATSGFDSATADLFVGRRWLLTPAPDCPPWPLARLQRFVSGLGARPSVIDAADHDRLMAAVSHLPQVAASALMRVAGELAGADGLSLAGAGLRDTTRLASSPADVWADICATNADHLGMAIDRYVEVLTSLRSRLSERPAVDAVFGPARDWRHELEIVVSGGRSLA